MRPAHEGARPALRCARPRDDARHRLVCFPYAGGGPHTYRNWDPQLEETEVWTAVLPGHVGRLDEPFAADIRSLARSIAAEMRRTLDGGRAPVLFGHSMGAWLALEVARALEAANAPVRALVVSGRSGPGFASDGEPIAQLEDADFARELGRRYGGLPEAVLNSAEIMELFLPILRADIAMMERYRPPTDRIAAPIHALGGADDPSTPIAGLDAWASATRGMCSTRRFPGGHFYLDGPPAELLAYLKAVLSLV